MNIKLTVFFDDPFWVGVFEKMEDGMLETSRIVFGTEPKDYEVYSYVLDHYFQLRFSRPIHVDAYDTRKINPKRLQRIVRRETCSNGIGTKAQQAIRLDYEARKLENKKLHKEDREEQEKIIFKRRQDKKKEKKKGH